MSGPTSIPQPPADLPRRRLVLEVLPAGASLHRFHAAAYGPIFFDTGLGSRFNAPDGTYGTLYSACDRRGAFAETFLRSVGSTSLSESFIENKAYASFSLLRPLRAVRMRGHGLSPVGATASVCSQPPPYDIPQAWSKALYDHPEQPDAILYGSRHDDDQLCLAIFDRAQDAILPQESENNLLGALWFYELLDVYGVSLSPAL